MNLLGVIARTNRRQQWKNHIRNDDDDDKVTGFVTINGPNGFLNFKCNCELVNVDEN